MATPKSTPSWRRIAFEELPRSAGVYALYERDRLIYIGSSWNLRSRVYNHRPTRRGLCPVHWDDGPCDCQREYTRFEGVNARRIRIKIRPARRGEDFRKSEARLIYRLKPPYNHVGVRIPARILRVEA